MKEIIITILIYSFILTIYTCYKDHSGYFTVDESDIIFAGPVMWVVYLAILIIRAIGINPGNSNKIKIRSQKYIDRFVKRVVKAFKKYRADKHPAAEYYFKFGDYYLSCNNDLEYLLPGELIPRGARFEKLEKKFGNLFFNQREDLYKSLVKYFEQTTTADLDKSKAVNLKDYVVRQLANEIKKDHNIYKFKGTL